MIRETRKRTLMPLTGHNGTLTVHDQRVAVVGGSDSAIAGQEIKFRPVGVGMPGTGQDAKQGKFAQSLNPPDAISTPSTWIYEGEPSLPR